MALFPNFSENSSPQGSGTWTVIFHAVKVSVKGNWKECFRVGGLGKSLRRCKVPSRHSMFFLSFSFGVHCKAHPPHLEPILTFNFMSRGCFSFQLRLSLKFLPCKTSLVYPGHWNWMIVSSKLERLPTSTLFRNLPDISNTCGLFAFNY